LIDKKFPTVTVVRSGKVLMAPLSDCITKTDNNLVEYQKLAETLSI
jgi:hypothetical protein